MYFADSPRKTIFAYDFDAGKGIASNRRVYVSTSGQPGVPDGIAVDRDGGVWCAYWDGWRVVRYDERGRETLRIHFPTPRPTACAFGGEGLNLLFVTSARPGVPDAGGAPAGDVFVLEPGTIGYAPFYAAV